MIFVESLLLIVHGLVAVPRFGNQHHHRVRKRAAAHDEHLYGIVNHGGIASAFDNHREQVPNAIAEEFRLEQGFARLHPVDIAAQRVDFAVVRDVAKRMSERPTRECIRAEALMDYRQRRLHARIREIGKIDLDLLRREHSLINNGVRRQAVEIRLGRRFFNSFANQVKLSFKFSGRPDVRILLNENLLEYRFHCFRRVTDRGIVCGHGPPSQQSLSCPHDGRFDDFFAPACRRRIPRKENHSNAVASRRRQSEAQFLAFALVKLMRNLHQDSGSVACVCLATFGSAMLQVHENLEGPPHNLVRFPAGNIDHETDSTTVMFELGIVQPLLWRHR